MFDYLWSHISGLSFHLYIISEIVISLNAFFGIVCVNNTPFRVQSNEIFQNCKMHIKQFL